MAHVTFAVVASSALAACCAVLVRLVRTTWRESALVVVPIVCDEPAASHVESGELSFFPLATPRHIHTMPQPRGMQ